MYQDDFIYHVYNRGAHRLNIFRSDFQFEYCLGLIEKYRLKYRVNILAYCLMPNPFHLMLQQCEGGSISRFLQTTFNAYVQAFNRMENHSGTIFQGAAKGILIDSDEYVVQLIAYIHYNPIAAGFVKAQKLWRYSDYQEWIDMKPFRFDGKVLHDLYFDNAKRYRELMKSYEQQKIEQRIEKYLLD